MATKHLNQIDLAARWNISHRTLAVTIYARIDDWKRGRR